MKGIFALAALSALSFCHGKPPPQVASNPPADLDHRAEDLAKKDAGDGKLLGETRRGVTYDTATRTELKFSLFDRFCYVLGVVGDETVGGFSLRLRDGEDKTIKNLTSKTGEATIAFCPDLSGVHRLEVRVADGAGHFAVAIFKKGRPGDRAAPTDADLDGAIAADAEKAAKGSTRVGALLEGSAPETEWPATLEKGACYWIGGAANAPTVKTLGLTVVDAQDKPLADQRSEEAKVALSVCPPKTGPVRLRVHMTGNGTYKFGVFKRK